MFLFDLIPYLIPIIGTGIALFFMTKEMAKIKNVYDNSSKEEFISFMNSRYQSGNKIDIQNNIRPDYKHPNCLTEGNIKHPEKVGRLKKKDNPFEI